MSAIPKDQATELRMLMKTRPMLAAQRPVTARSARVVAIASGKGGVGKTNIAVNLSLCLARRGLRVALVDADLGMANADVVMNVQSHFDLSHVVRGQRTIDEVAVSVERGLRLVAGASGLACVADLDSFARQELVRELGRLEDQSDIVILDCGAGISQNVLAFAHSADELLIVTTPEPTALTDAYALIKVLSRAPSPPPMGLIVNQAISAREGRQVAQRVASVAARFLGVSLTNAGMVLQDRHVPLAVRQRIPFIVKYPGCPASTCLTALAERVDQSVTAGSSRPGFFGRVARFFY
jgi:flagellar biosynthesis protein FlhG